MTQPDLLSAYVPPCDSHVLAPGEQQRLSGQNRKILLRLQQGPATNVELSAIALKYTSRVHDIRSAGFAITCERFPRGLAVYTLEQP